MYLKIFSTNVVLTAILFIMVHVNKSFARGRNLKKFLKYDEGKMSWLTQKRTTGYRNPCESEESTVATSSLDTHSCPTCTYYPSTLNQVKCSIGNNLNARGKTSCNYNIAGDCIDVHATITVVKVYSNFDSINRDITFTVACACMLPPV